MADAPEITLEERELRKPKTILEFLKDVFGDAFGVRWPFYEFAEMASIVHDGMPGSPHRSRQQEGG